MIARAMALALERAQQRRAAAPDQRAALGRERAAVTTTMGICSTPSRAAEPRTRCSQSWPRRRNERKRLTGSSQRSTRSGTPSRSTASGSPRACRSWPATCGACSRRARPQLGVSCCSACSTAAGSRASPSASPAAEATGSGRPAATRACCSPICVAPTGFEPVFGRGHVFASSLA